MTRSRNAAIASGTATVCAAAVFAAALAFAARCAFAAEEPAAGAVRAARDLVLARPEFRYESPKDEESLFESLLRWWSEIVADFHQSHPVLFVLAMAAMALLAAALIAHIVWTWRVARRAAYETDDPRDLEAALRRLDPAPFRARALEHAAAGRLDEAVRDLYSALLLTLDRRGAVRFAQHKALLDYRIESAGDAPARAALDRFAAAYPPGSFGRRPPSPGVFGDLVATLDGIGSPR